MVQSEILATCLFKYLTSRVHYIFSVKWTRSVWDLCFIYPCQVRRGSLLSQPHSVLQKLASISEGNPLAPRNSRGFLFQTLSPEKDSSTSDAPQKQVRDMRLTEKRQNELQSITIKSWNPRRRLKLKIQNVFNAPGASVKVLSHLNIDVHSSKKGQSRIYCYSVHVTANNMTPKHKRNRYRT